MTTVPSADPADRLPVPPLFDRLVDDTSLLAPRASAPGVDAIVTRYLATRDGRHGGLLGQLVCPVSRLPVLVKELARSSPARPVDVSLVVDTGLGAVPKALSTVFSRSSLLTPARSRRRRRWTSTRSGWSGWRSSCRTTWSRWSPRRPVGTDDDGVAEWLDAVRRVAGHGCTPKLRCGGARASDVPSVAEVDRFVRVVAEAKRGFVVLGALPVVSAAVGTVQFGVLNLLVAAARALTDDDVAEALTTTDGAALADEALAWSPGQVREVRTLLPRCGGGTGPRPRRRAVRPRPPRLTRTTPPTPILPGAGQRGAHARSTRVKTDRPSNEGWGPRPSPNQTCPSQDKPTPAEAGWRVRPCVPGRGALRRRLGSVTVPRLAFLGPHATFTEQALLTLPEAQGADLVPCAGDPAGSRRSGTGGPTPAACRSRTASRARCRRCSTGCSTTRH